MGSDLADETDGQSSALSDNISATDALNLLLDGNQRFVAGKMRVRDYPAQVAETFSGQHPFAVVLACMDSRVPPEIVLDQGLGDIYIVRMAGVAVDTDVLGCLEYAAAIGGTRLIMVLGHTDCGAVKGACDGIELGHLTDLLKKLAPAVAATETDGPRNSTNKEFVDAVVHNNVKHAVEKILRESSIISDLTDTGDVMVIGAVYDVANGDVMLVEG